MNCATKNKEFKGLFFRSEDHSSNFQWQSQ